MLWTCACDWWFKKQVTEGGGFKALTKNTGKHAEYHDSSFCARRVLTRTNERFAGQLTCISEQVNGIRRVMCLSTGERRTSERQTLTDSTRNCTNCWPSRPQTWHWPPSSHLMKLKSKGLSGGNAWKVNREDTIDIEWHFHVFTLPTFFVEWQTSPTYTSACCRACCHMCSRISEKVRC